MSPRALAVLIVCLAGCVHRPEPLEPEPSPEPDDTTGMMEASWWSIPSVGSFAEVDGWRGVRLGMSADEVQQVLVDSAVPFERSTLRRYHRTLRYGHTSQPMFHVQQPHGRWTIRCSTRRTVRAIRFDAQDLAPPAVAEVLREFESRYGPPTEPTDGSVLRWRNETLELTLEMTAVEGQTWVVGRLRPV